MCLVPRVPELRAPVLRIGGFQSHDRTRGITHRWHRLQTRFGMVAFPEKAPPARGILRCDPIWVATHAQGGDPANSRGARDWLRPLQPAGQGLPHGQDRREHNVRRLRLPQHRPPLHPGEPEGESGLGRCAWRNRSPEAGDACPGRAGLAACPEAVDCSHTRHSEAGAPGREHRSGSNRTYVRRSP